MAEIICEKFVVYFSNHHHHLSEHTKKIMQERNTVQRRAALSGDQEDWREFRRLRNQCVTSQRMDRKEWERRKLSSTENSPAKMWRSVKGIIGWANSGPPTKLFHEGKFVNSPSGLASTLNNFFINKVKRL